MRFDAVVAAMISVVALVIGGLDVLGFIEAKTSAGTILVWLGVVAGTVSRLAWRARND